MYKSNKKEKRQPLRVSDQPGRRRKKKTHLLLSRISHVFVGVKQRSDIHGLPSPDVPVYRPVEGEFQAATVQ